MLLGEMLVYRYQLISKEERSEALARQKGADRGRHLGEILVAMGAITESQLREVLEAQLSQRDPWRGAF